MIKCLDRDLSCFEWEVTEVGGSGGGGGSFVCKCMHRCIQTGLVHVCMNCCSRSEGGKNCKVLH